MTGHAHHFLQRLDRLPQPHVELALSLYNDVPMLRFILDEERVPERVTRAAICLGAPERGPHIIVTRDGRFVTALAEGMKPYDAHVVPRASLDFMAGRYTSLRERLRRSEAMGTRDEHVRAIVEKITRAGARFSREDFDSIAGLHPWLRMEFFRGAVRYGRRCLDLRKSLPSMKRITQSAREATLKDAWNSWWAMNHFTVLTGVDLGWDLYGELEKLLGDQVVLPLNQPHSRMGVFAGMIRGAWLAGRLARSRIALYATWFHRATELPDLIKGGVALLAIGARHPSARGEVIAALAPRSEPDGSPAATHRHKLRGVFEAMFADDQAELDEATLKHAQRILPEPAASSPTSALTASEKSLALSATSQGLFDSLVDFDGFGMLLTSARTYALFEPEGFFLPREHFDYVLPRWQPSLSEHLFAPTRASTPAPTPVHSVAQPGRNEPCPCGSGRKYKQCCLGGARK